MKPKNGFQRVVACLLAVILMLTSAPLAGLAGIELPEVFKTEAKAGVANYNGIAAAWWAENHLYDSWSSLLGQGYYDDGGDCANFVSQCIYMGGMNMTPSWNTSGFHARFATVSDGAWIRAHQLYNYVVSQGGTSIQGPQANQVSIGDLIFWKTTNDGRMHHSAIVVAIENGIPVIAYHSTRYSNGAYINERNKNWTLGYSSDRTFLVKMNGEPCVASNPKDFDVYIAARSTTLRVSPNKYAGIAYEKSIFAGDYVHVYRTENNWGYIFYYGSWGWVDLSAFNYNGHASSYRPSHVFGSWFTEVEPTCISTGTSKRVCSRCGYAETKQIPPKGHTSGAEPTCITPQTCTFCGCLLKDALGHDFEEKFVDADCYNGATISGNCKRCDLKYSYAATTAPWSGWSPVSHSVDDPADERQRVAYRWRQRDTKVTNTAVESGWTLMNKTWEQTGSGSIEYVPQWATGFNTSHWLYSTYNKTPRYASETATSKTTVSTSDIGYIFWHYCRGTTDGNIDSNRTIFWYYGGPKGEHKTYHAVKVDSPFRYNGADEYRLYENFPTNGCQDTKYWFSLNHGSEGLITVKRCNYTDYRVKCSWEKYSDWSDWTVASELPENIQNMIKNGQSTLTVGNTTYTVEKRNEYQYSLKNALGHDWHEDSSYLADESTGRHIWKVVTASTETESGKAVAICNRDSSHTMEKALPSTGCNHSWGEWSEIPCPEGGVSKRTCAKCGSEEEKVIEEGHVWGEWKTVKEAVACKEDGLERRICSRTPQNPPAESHIQERTIPAHELEFVDSVNPTCTEEGYDLYECAVCGAEEKRNVVPALGHDMGEWILKTAPTCTESGKEVSTCRRCGYTEDRDVSPLGHDVVSNELPVTVINPDDERIKTICEIHETTYKCSRCDYTEPTKTEEISHDWEKNSDGSLKWNTVTKAEHGVNGEEANRCLRHESHVQTRFVPMPSDHVWKEKVETKPCSYDQKTGTEMKGTKTTFFVCEICNDKVPGDTEIVNHDFGEWKNVKEATCTDEGINRRECKVCSFPEEQIISATGHSTSPLDEAYEASSDKMELVSSVKNVCGSGTIDTYRCKHIDKNTNERCTYTVIVGEVNDHNFGDYVIDKQPTCTEPGSKHRECQNEGCTCKTNPEEIPPIGHNYAESTKTAATCTEPEKILMVCKNDSSHRYEKETGQPLGHDIVSDAKVEPTCVKTGLTEGTHCKRCSVIFEKQEVIPALGHDYGEWVDDGNGKTHTKTCKREICNESVTEHIVKKDHVMKETDRKEATCYAEGYVEYTCSECGYNYREPLKKTEHTPGEAVKENVVDPTCTEEGSYDEVVYCSVEECKAELSRNQKTTEKLGHDYGDWTSVDGENHKRICKRDESHVETAKHVMKETDRKEATCTTDGYINYKCDDCGYTYSETIKAPGHKYEETVTDPTCLTEGFTTHTCSVCGNSYVDSYVPALGHDYGEWVDDGNGKTHTKTCKREICNDSVTEHIVKKDHVMKETDRKEATCYAEGYVEYTCSECGYNYREPLKKTEHTPGEAVKENVVDPTCTEEGSYDEVVYCSVEECKAELSRTQKTTEKLGHDYGDWTSVDGENHKRICKRDESHVETAKHVMKETDRKEATCYAEGYVEYTCSDCGYNYREPLEKIAHTPGEAVKENVVDPTCTEEGSYDEVVYCSVEECKAELSRTQKTTEKLGHDYGDWTSVDGENHKRVCKRDESHVETAKHVMKESDRKEATCYAEGYVEYTCSDCGYSYSETLTATGHAYGDWKTVKSATCTEAGLEQRICANDPTHIETRELSALGHDWSGEWVVTKEATKDEKGEETLCCKRDPSHTQTRETEWNYFTVTFVANNEIVSVVDLEKGKNITKVPNEPEVPDCADDRHEKKGKWEEYTLSDVSTTVYAEYELLKPGESPIITEKTATLDPDTDVATINLSAASKGKKVINTVSELAPLDIVMVIDESGSMENKLGSTKNAVRDFVNMVVEDAKKYGVDHRISMIGFACNFSDEQLKQAGKNDKKSNYTKHTNTEILSTTKNANINYDDATSQNYADSMMSVLDGNKTNSHLLSAIDRITAKGSTAANLGLEMAQRVFAESKAADNENRQKIVVFITDGSPTSYSGFETNVANSALRISRTLKDNGAKIYSIGIIRKINPKTSLIEGIDESNWYDNTNNQNKFLHFISSNYPTADSLNSSIYDGETNVNYYFAANDVKELSAIFTSIEKDMSTTVSDFDNVTLIDTISKNFTMTTEQEAKLRKDVTEKFSVTNNDIIVTRNADGTTTVELRGLNPTEKTVDGEKRFVVEVSFEVTANENATKAGTYETNTEDAGVIIKDGNAYIELFKTPKVDIAHDRVVAVYKINGEVYKIVDTNKQPKTRLKSKRAASVVAPDFDCPDGCIFSGWNTDGAEFADGYEVFNATLTRAERTVTWSVGDKEVKQTVKVGDYITIPKVEAPKGYVVCGWSEIPTVMPNEDVTVTAQLKKEHNYVAVIMAESGKAVLICEDCLDILDATVSYEMTDKCCEYSSSYKITIDGSLTDVGTITVMIPKSDYQFVNESQLDIGANGTETDSMIVLTLSGDTDVTVTNYSADSEHSFSEWTVVTEATCTREGVHERTCLSCGAVEQEITAKTDHKDENGDGICDNCGEKLQESTPGGKCSHICHSTNSFSKLIWAIIRLLCKIFNTNRTCSCGAKHW